MNQRGFNIAIFLLLIAVVIVGRLVSDIPNFTPVAAVAIFAGFMFRSRLLALAVPLIGMAATDLLFEGVYDYGTMAVVWIALAIPALLGKWLQKPVSLKTDAPRWKRGIAKALRLFIVAGSASVLFFLASNFAVWAFSGFYAHTIEGMSICFATAIPFFKLSLAGNLMFVFAIFGVYHILGDLAKARGWNISRA